MPDELKSLPSDMDDAAEIAEYEQRLELNNLVAALTICAEAIDPDFRIMDEAAQRAKSSYFKYARASAWLGALAVFFAILQLSQLARGWSEAWSLPVGAWTLEGKWLLPATEFLMAAAAVGVALVGLGGRKQQSWFLQRYQAERLRLLKYHFLTRSQLWSGNEQTLEKCRLEVRAEVEEIMVSQYPELESWISAGSVPEVLEAPELSDAEWRQFREYYLKKRLREQTEHFVSRLKDNVIQDNKTRILPSVLFFGSVAFVLAHFSIELVGTVNDSVGRGALLLAASLPGFGAVVRARRGVLEFARNASRCETTYHVLLKLGVRLRDASNIDVAFREIGFCEQVLETDVREWLRLMVESEWFG